jgi:hypothetical protein
LNESNTATLVVLMLSVCHLTASSGSAKAEYIAHGAEFEILLRQYRAAWVAEDKELDKRLAELESKPRILII